MPYYVEALRLLSKLPKNLNGLFKDRIMETKELKIQVPEGYEIDKENSSFECVKFKPIKKVKDYKDVEQELFKGEEINYCINAQSKVKGSIFNRTELEFIQCGSEKQLAKVIAIAKLMNVAKYLNDGWQPNWGNDKEYKYWIGVKECYNKEIYIEHSSSYNFSYVYFKSKEAAQQAIDILGEETIRLALSTDW